MEAKTNDGDRNGKNWVIVNANDLARGWGVVDERTDCLKHWSDQKDQSSEKGTTKSSMIVGMGERNYREK